jgi:ClpP class serine protease
MGFYSEYLNKNLSFVQLCAERKRLLQAISEIRGRPVLVFASDITKSDCPISIDYSDILPFSDQLSTIEGKEIDVILETPGGFAEVVEDLVRIIRKRFERMGVIIPGMAKSAGTIFTMAADEILMGESSALGPIDAQIMMGNGKRFSADAFLEGLNTIRKEAEKKAWFKNR